MLKPSKKIVKKEIKQDALLTNYVKATSFYYENKRYVSYGVTALIVLVAGAVIFYNTRTGNNEKAAAALGKIISIYDAGAADPNQYKNAIAGVPERNIMGLKAVVDNFGGSDAGEMARLYLANAYLYTGQYDDAIKQFDSFSGGSSMLKASAYAGLAAAYEGKKEYGKAAPEYERAAETVKGASEAPEYMNGAGRCYGFAGEKEKALTLFKRLKKEYPTSSFARDADRYISQFSV
jgi:tetratricopeptide (TPR) repeat protein